MEAWPPPVYRVRTTFRAPLPFVYAWCTKFTAEDAALEHDDYVRRVISQGRQRVVFEDLYTRPTGWLWQRATITLRPPDRWHADIHGNLRDWTLDYELRAIGKERTELTIRGRRRPFEKGTRNPARRGIEREIATGWKHFGAALEREYRHRQRRR